MYNHIYVEFVLTYKICLIITLFLGTYSRVRDPIRFRIKEYEQEERPQQEELLFTLI